MLVAFALLALGLSGEASAQSRGIEVAIKASDAPDAAVLETVQLYGASHALVIGIDAYTNGWPRLSNGVNDARAVAAELESRGFEVTLRTDLDSDELKRAFEQFYVVKGADPEARLFVWFSGHGATVGEEAFLVPADAPPPQTGPSFKLSALSLRRFGEFVRLADSKHALAVFDSCFAGTIFDAQRELPPPAITRATTLPVRQFLTSGDAGQTVSDDGTFRKLFLRALRDEDRANANGDGYLTASELGLFLSDRMVNLRLGQTPRYGKLRDPDYDRGDFVFVLPNAAGGVGAPSAEASVSVDMQMWDRIRDSSDAADFETFIDTYPESPMIPFARNRLESLSGDRFSGNEELEAYLSAISEPCTTPTVSEELRARAKSGDAEAQYEIGSLFDPEAQYEIGSPFEGGPPSPFRFCTDRDKAYIWYRKAADQGHREAQYKVGYLHYIREEDQEALSWFLRAAEKGSPYAALRLGEIYYKGYGISKNYFEAVRWFFQAAKLGDSLATAFLGTMYRDGKGFARHDPGTEEWFRYAAELGNRWSGFALTFTGDGLEGSVEFLRKAAEAGLLQAQYYLGFRYERGMGVPQDYEEAAKWYRAVAEGGRADGQFALGGLYEAGRGAPIDYVLAHMWFNLAGAQGDEFAIRFRDEIAEKMTGDQIAEAQRLARAWEPRRRESER